MDLEKKILSETDGAVQGPTEVCWRTSVDLVIIIIENYEILWSS